MGLFKIGTNVPHGVVRFVKNGGDIILEGMAQDGKMTGFGRIVWYNGAYYIGMWSNEQRHGQGKFVYLSLIHISEPTRPRLI